VTAPTLPFDTERLHFRWWQPNDEPLAAALWGDPHVTAFIDARPRLEIAAIRERLDRELKCAAEQGFQYWPIFLKADGKHVGCCGLKPFAAPERVLEIGFHIRPEYWGKGLATEAARAVIEHAFANLSIAWLFSGHHPRNDASRRTLAKLGFRQTGEVLFPPTGLIHPAYRLDAPQAVTGPSNQVQSERLVLRPHQLDDFGDSAAMWADPSVTRFIGGKPFSEEEVWTKILRYAGHWSLLGFGYWVAREKASGRFVGEVGFADFRRDIAPSFGAAPEVGWALSPWAWGKGFATEAVRTAITWLEARRGPSRTVCMITPDNRASIHVAQKCRYQVWQETSYKGAAIILLERNA
jgi:RimJ/RimL family protein N-acetyltransferase